jgi:hypothetical protein
MGMQQVWGIEEVLYRVLVGISEGKRQLGI